MINEDFSDWREKFKEGGLKLNVGCRNKPLPGFTNIDIVENKLADVIDNGFELNKFEDNSVDEIHAVHMAEHLNNKQFTQALQVWYRKLKPKGKLVLSVPDGEKMSALLLLTKDKNVVKNLFYGSQLDDYWDFHRSLHTKDSLTQELTNIGFGKIQEWNYWEEWPYNYIDTYASCVYPHMLKKIKMDNGRMIDLGGTQLSLNMKAVK